MAFFGHFRQKWLFLAIFRKSSPVATGLKPVKMPKIGHFPEKGPKVGVPGRGFTSTPRAGAPRFPGLEKGPISPPGGEGLPGPPGGVPDGVSRDPVPAARPGEPRGPGARGWCKTPLATPSGAGPGGLGGPREPGGPSPRGRPGASPGSRIPGSGPGDRSRTRGPGGALREPSRGPGAPWRGGFYINPSRRGPAVPRGPGGYPAGNPGRGRPPWGYK